MRTSATNKIGRGKRVLYLSSHTHDREGRMSTPLTPNLSHSLKEFVSQWISTRKTTVEVTTGVISCDEDTSFSKVVHPLLDK